MALTAKKKRMLGVMFIITTCIFIALGQLVGAALFFDLTSIPLEYLSLDALYHNWVNYHTDQAIKPYLQIGIAASILVALLPLGMVIIMVFALREKEEIHGSARFANDMELSKSGMFPVKREKPSLLLGKMDKGRFKGKFVELEGQTFLGLSAPTGTGKGVGFVLPNLVNYPDSVVNTDFKLENFFKTAGFRQSQGQDIYLISFDGYATSEEDRDVGILRSHKWNPFHYVRRLPEFRIADILSITTSLYPVDGSKDKIWPSSAGKLFLGLLLWMLDTEEVTGKTPTFPYLLSIIGIEGGLTPWMKREIAKDYLSDDCLKQFNGFISCAEETQASIKANLESPLGIFADKTVMNVMSGNDFDFRDLRRKGISVYVSVAPSNSKAYQEVMNLFFEQLIKENTRVLPELDDTLTHQCLLLLDEFPVLGKINQISTSIGFTRQYNLRYALIYQDYAQLEDVYGREGAKNITSNLAAELIYPPKEVNDRVKKISESLGTKTVKVEGESISRGKHMSRGRSTSKQKRALMMPHEIIELGNIRHATADMGLKTLIFKENQRSFIVNKIISFEEPAISERIAFSKQHIPEIPLLPRSA